MKRKKPENIPSSATIRAVSDRELAKSIRAPLAQIRRMVAAGELPRPLRYRGTFWWSADELDAWARMGCLEQEVPRAGPADETP